MWAAVWELLTSASLGDQGQGLRLAAHGHRRCSWRSWACSLLEEYFLISYPFVRGQQDGCSLMALDRWHSSFREGKGLSGCCTASWGRARISSRGMVWARGKTPTGSPWTLLLCLPIGALSRRSVMRRPRPSLSPPSLSAESKFAGPGSFLHGEDLEDEVLALQMTGSLQDALRRTGSADVSGIPLGRHLRPTVGVWGFHRDFCIWQHWAG